MNTYIVRRNKDFEVVSTAGMRDNDMIIIHGNSSVFITSKPIADNDVNKIKGRVRRFLQRLSQRKLSSEALSTSGVYIDPSVDTNALIGDLFDP